MCGIHKGNPQTTEAQPSGEAALHGRCLLEQAHSQTENDLTSALLMEPLPELSDIQLRVASPRPALLHALKQGPASWPRQGGKTLVAGSPGGLTLEGLHILHSRAGTFPSSLLCIVCEKT